MSPYHQVADETQEGEEGEETTGNDGGTEAASEPAPEAAVGEIYPWLLEKVCCDVTMVTHRVTMVPIRVNLVNRIHDCQPFIYTGNTKVLE